MKWKLLFLLLITVTLSKAQPVFDWVKNVGGAMNDLGKHVIKDAAGNLYVAGMFWSTIDFDPGPGEAFLTSAGSWDVFIQKFNAAGNFQWARRIGGTSTDNPFAIVADASGNIIIAVQFQGTIDVDPGPAVNEFTASGTNDFFISQLDEDGNFVWAKQFGGTGQDRATTMTIDASGNLFIAGEFANTVDFDPGPGVENRTGNSSVNAFVLKLNSSGEFIWVSTLTGSGFAASQEIALDATGNIFISGFFQGQVDFDAGPGVNNITAKGYNDIFISKLDPSGNFLWTKVMGTLVFDAAISMGVDADGNVYTAGYFEAVIDIDPGPAVYNLTSNGMMDVYICKLDGSGNFIWAKNFGGTANDACNKMTLDEAGNIFITGFFSNTVDFDPGPGLTALTSNGVEDLFLIKFDPSGNFQWAQSFGGPGTDVGLDILTTTGDNIYLTGRYALTADFDPGAGSQTLTSVDRDDAFILHLSNPPVLPLTLLQFQAVNSNTTVSLQWKTQQEFNVSHFMAERSIDGKNFKPLGKIVAANSLAINQYSFVDALPLTGTSFYRLKMVDADGKFTHSRIVAVNRKDNPGSVHVFPNPATEILYVQASGKETITVEITDASGRVWQQQQVALNGNTSFSVNVQQLVSGKYFLVLKGKEKKVAGFLKQ